MEKIFLAHQYKTFQIINLVTKESSLIPLAKGNIDGNTTNMGLPMFGISPTPHKWNY
jgi:hypothetical protein